MLKYQKNDSNEIVVILENIVLGTIRKVDGGFAYFHKNTMIQGTIFKTIKEVKESIE